VKVKIFSCEAGEGNLKMVEDAINEFITDKKVIDLKQSESIDGQSQVWSLTITVMYE
jgi:hypothetical protein